jgi:hypothetical protein
VSETRDAIACRRRRVGIRVCGLVRTSFYHNVMAIHVMAMMEMLTSRQTGTPAGAPLLLLFSRRMGWILKTR